MRSIDLFKSLSTSLLLVAVSACGAFEDDDPLIEWSGNITEQNERFILSYDEEKYPGLHMQDHEDWWLSVQECAGIGIDISGSPLIIEYTIVELLPPGASARIELDDRYIRVDERYLEEGFATRHEMVHYLLYLIGTPLAENQNHESPWFTFCV